MKNKINPFIVTEDAKSLAKAVLAGDSIAADGLIDWILENRNHGGYSVIKYTELLEDTLRETWNCICKNKTELAPLFVTSVTLYDTDVDEIWNSIWRCTRAAITIGRTGPQ